jgi:branched-chain amino acid transport system permease protein
MPGMTTSEWLRRAARVGVVAGVALIYLSLVGLVGAFEERDVVTDVLKLGTLMLAAVAVLAGYRAALPPRTLAAPPGVLRLAAGVLAGAVAGAFLGAVLLLTATPIDLQTVFVRLNPALIAFLSFDAESPVAGAALQVGLNAVLGGIGAGLVLLPDRFRRPLVFATLAVALVSMAEPYIRPRLDQLDMDPIADFLYSGHGLTVAASVVVFVLVTAVAVAWAPARGQVDRRLAVLPPERRRSVRFTSFILIALLVLALPIITGQFISQVLVLVGLYLLLALGLNIVVGYAGLLDLGYVAFFAVGAYLMAILTSADGPLGAPMVAIAGEQGAFFLALPIVMVGAALTGLMIGAPVLRLRGDYLAIVTLGFGEIARILFLSDALEPWLGGVQGIIGIPSPLPQRVDFALGPIEISWSGPQVIFYPIVLFCVLAALVAYRLAGSRVGRAWNAMREDEEVAEITGVNTVNYKLLAFAMGAGLGCLSGALFAIQLGSVFPGSFNVLVSITVLAIIILGGMGSIPGVILGALVLIGLPELLREFAEYRLLVYGGVLVAMMLLRPEGLIPNRGRQRELHEQDEEDEQYEREAGEDVAKPVVA